VRLARFSAEEGQQAAGAHQRHGQQDRGRPLPRRKICAAIDAAWIGVDIVDDEGFARRA
jgi:hypothetical protein